MRVGDTVVLHAKKFKEKYNQRRASVLRLNSRVAVLKMLDGPEEGSQHRARYESMVLEAGDVPHAKKLKSMSCVSTGSSASSSQPAPATPAMNLSPAEEQDAACAEMFGDLSAFG